MKNFFSSKLNILLTILLTAVIAVGIVFGISIFKKPVTICADFSEMTESEIVSWVQENEVGDLITIEYEYDEAVPEGKVIYQSTKAGEKLTDTCTIYVSKGIDPNSKYEIVTNENTTLDSLKEDLASYGITNYTVVYDETSDMEGIVLAISPNPVSKVDTITITVGGKDPNKVEEEKTGDKVYIDEIAYLGKSEADFKTALNKLGFENLSKDTNGVYSPKRSEGVIAAYSPDGNQKTDAKITYYLSLGAYTSELAKTDFEGLTSAKANELIKTEKFAMYSYTLETTKTTTTEKTGGTLYDCSVSGTKIACKLASNGTSSTKATISEYGYLGKTETEFKEALTKLGFTSIVKNADGVYSSRTAGVIGAYSPDGEQPIDATITYYLSLGDYTSALAKTDFEGKTLTEANTLIKTDKFSMLGYKLSTTKTTTTEKTENTLYDCSYSSKTISCKLASGSGSTTNTTGTSSTKATISEYGYLGKTEAEFKSALNSLGFTNLVKDPEGVYSSRTAGVIGAYSPDGSQPIDTTITYYLSLGNYTNALAKTDFEGKTSSEANTLIAKNKFKLLGYSLKTTKTSTTEKTNDTLYDCSVSGKVISCKLANNSSSSSSGSSGSSSSTTGYINPTSYAGKSESDFKSALTALGFSNVVKDASGTYSNNYSSGVIAYYDPDGTQNLDTKITYWLSLGAYSSTQAASDFNGKTVSEANTALATKKYSISGISSTVATTETETSSYTAGTLYDCSYSNKKVACKLAKAVTVTTTARLENYDYIAQNYSSTVSVADAETKVRNYLTGQGFTNITITKVSDTLAVGQIAGVSVDGNSSYAAGSYAKTAAIEVKIVETQIS